MKSVIVLAWLYALFDLVFFVFGRLWVAPYSLALGALAVFVMRKRPLGILPTVLIVAAIGAVYSFDPLWAYMTLSPQVPMTGSYFDGSTVVPIDTSQPDFRLPIARGVWYAASTAISVVALLILHRMGSKARPGGDHADTFA